MTTCTKSVDLPVPPDEAFALITEPERMRRWLTVTAAVDLRAGGTYRWTVNPGHVAAGTYREVEPGRRVVFGFGWEGESDLAPDSSTVTITIEPVDGGSRVTLEHDGLTPEQAERHAQGWAHYLGRLETLGAKGEVEADPQSWVPDLLDPMTAAEAVLAAIQPMLRNLTPEDQPKPTPCADFTCHDVAVHLLDSLVVLGGMAGVDVVIPERTSLEDKVSTAAATTIDAWRARGIEGTVVGRSGNDLPAPVGAGLVSIELLVHGWDLAQGSGQELYVSDAVVAYVHSLAEPIVPPIRGRLFGDELEAGPDATALERLAAFTGRVPMAARVVPA